MNEYTVVNSVSRSHDANGNLVDDGSKEYVYDAFNRLVRVVDKGSSVTLAEYAYDHGGRRVARDVDHDLDTAFDEEVRYYYLGGSVVEEATPADVVLRQYVWGGGALLEYRTSDWSFEPIYCHENGYGSILRTTGQGTISDGELDEFDYDALGNVTRTGGLNDTSVPYRYRGALLDGATGIYRLREGAAFDSVLGRAFTRLRNSRAAFALNRYQLSLSASVPGSFWFGCGLLWPGGIAFGFDPGLTPCTGQACKRMDFVVSGWEPRQIWRGDGRGGWMPPNVGGWDLEVGTMYNLFSRIGVDSGALNKMLELRAVSEIERRYYPPQGDCPLGCRCESDDEPAQGDIKLLKVVTEVYLPVVPPFPFRVELEVSITAGEVAGRCREGLVTKARKIRPR